jgi:starch-binding outer membrane protein, SusD/RagB family
MNTIKKIFILVVCLGCWIIVDSCTKLDEEVFDKVPADQWGKTQEQRDALIGPLYASLSDYFAHFEALNCVTDEQVAPSRGGDWSEPEWRFMEEHTWPTDYWQFDGLWTWCYISIARINQQMAISDDQTIAELRALRAFYHYILLDNFGNVIIADEVESDETSAQQSSRADVYSFVENELMDVLPTLSTDVRANYGRMSKYVGHMILAKLYLNAGVYTGTAQWEKARVQCDSIILSNKFSVAENFLSNFNVTNQNSTETILATPFDKSKKTGFYNSVIGLHYLNQLTYDLGYTPWNGYCTYAEFYDSFEDGDIRKNMWITGQQFDSKGEPLYDDNVPAIFTKDVPAFAMPAGTTARLAGYRNGKYEIQRGNAGVDQDNDFVIFRIADVYLMRGEAYFRLGNEALALEDINFIRAIRDAAPFASPLTADMILAERGRELAFEYHRRQDLIRFDAFTKAHQFKPVTEKFRELFPIPFNQMSLNPNLQQNPGY